MNTIPQSKSALFCISPLWHSESYFEFFLLVGSNLYSKVGYVCYIKEIAEVCECEFIHVNLTQCVILPELCTCVHTQRTKMHF